MHFRIYICALFVLAKHDILICSQQPQSFNYLSTQLPSNKAAQSLPILPIPPSDLKRLAELPLLPQQAHQSPQNAYALPMPLVPARIVYSQTTALAIPPPFPRQPNPNFAASQILHKMVQERKASCESQQTQVFFTACELEAMRIKLEQTQMQSFFANFTRATSGHLPTDPAHLSSSMRIRFEFDKATHAAKELQYFQQTLAANANAQKPELPVIDSNFHVTASNIPAKVQAAKPLLTIAPSAGSNWNNQQFKAQYAARTIAPRSHDDDSNQRCIYLTAEQIAFAKQNKITIHYQ